MKSAATRNALTIDFPKSLRSFVLLTAFCALASTALPAQVLETLYSFDGGNSDGGVPAGALLEAGDGRFYGTTSVDGANGSGAIFSITRSGEVNIVYGLPSSHGSTSGPSGLIQTVDGHFFGLTSYGGTSFAGTFYEINYTGQFNALYNFCPQLYQCPHGELPMGGLLQASNGFFYGTTHNGGDSPVCGLGCGTIYGMTPKGHLTTIYDFCQKFDCRDGNYPTAGLIQASDGNFYGSTSGGGAYCTGINVCGTVFEVTPKGKLTTLYSFSGSNGDGGSPNAPLVQLASGNFYSTTVGGGVVSAGCLNGCGTVFEITPGGKLTTLYEFCSQSECTDGAMPNGGLIQATDGDLYGTTTAGGISCLIGGGCGTIFKITPSGTLTTLYSFCSGGYPCADGYGPAAGLTQATDGNLYGTTGGGGASYFGTVFNLSVGLGPFVKTNPTSGPVGATVMILGNNLQNTTKVTFNGTPATFTATNSAISTTMPAGATSGTVTATTPSGTLSSNVIFRVRP